MEHKRKDGHKKQIMKHEIRYPAGEKIFSCMSLEYMEMACQCECEDLKFK